MTNAMESRYEGNYLDALDLPEGRLVAVVIEAVADPFSEKDSAKKPIKSAILSFKGKSKRLILNKTGYSILKAMFGKEAKDWIGQTIKIQRRYLDAQHGFGVNNTLCIRIIPPIGTPILKSAASFMGQEHPYGGPKKKEPAKQPANDTGFVPDPDPPADIDELPAEPDQWKMAVYALRSLAGCKEFRETILPTCPAELREGVEKVLAERELRLGSPAQ